MITITSSMETPLNSQLEQLPEVAQSISKSLAKDAIAVDSIISFMICLLLWNKIANEYY